MQPWLVWDVDREIFRIGMFAFRWYSLMFAAGFALGYWVMLQFFRAEKRPLSLLDPLLIHLLIGTIVGARLGHCLFYEPQAYLKQPWRILYLWEGGLASHGGFLGVLIALWLFARKHPETPFLWLADRVTIPTMIEAAFIRIGNLFNSEILGKPTDVPWAVIFARYDLQPRHPTPIYEALAYLSCWAVTYSYYRWCERQPLPGRITGIAMVMAYSFRVLIEQYKENQVAFENALPLNMGQLLSIPYIIVGIVLIYGWQRTTSTDAQR